MPLEMNQLCRFLIIMIFFLRKNDLHLQLQFQKVFSSALASSLSSSLRTLGWLAAFDFMLCSSLLLSGLHVIYLNSCTIFHSFHSLARSVSQSVRCNMFDPCLWVLKWCALSYHLLWAKQGSSSQLSLLYKNVMDCVRLCYLRHNHAYEFRYSLSSSLFGCSNPLFADQNKNVQQFQYTLSPIG